MKLNKKRIIKKANKLLIDYKDEQSFYYKELNKSLTEYNESKLMDKETNDLYLKHINELCELMIEKKHANFIILAAIIVFLGISYMAINSSLKYYNASSELNKSIKKANRRVSMLVAYKDLENFNAVNLSDNESFMDLNPLSLSVVSTSEDKEQFPVKYNIYLIPQNDDLYEDEVIDESLFMYNVSAEDDNSGIKSMKDCFVKNDKILLYSGEMLSNSKENIDIRMWINNSNNNDTLNKKYRFKLYVEGEVK